MSNPVWVILNGSSGMSNGCFHHHPNSIVFVSKSCFNPLAPAPPYKSNPPRCLPPPRTPSCPIRRPRLEEQQALARLHHSYRLQYGVTACLSRPPVHCEFFHTNFGYKLLGTTPQGHVVLLIRVGAGLEGGSVRSDVCICARACV